VAYFASLKELRLLIQPVIDHNILREKKALGDTRVKPEILERPMSCIAIGRPTNPYHGSPIAPTCFARNNGSFFGDKQSLGNLVRRGERLEVSFMRKSHQLRLVAIALLIPKLD
jgi:hypothetical protein